MDYFIGSNLIFSLFQNYIEIDEDGGSLQSEKLHREKRQVDSGRFQYLTGADEGSGDAGGQFLSYGDYYTDDTFVDQEASSELRKQTFD